MTGKLCDGQKKIKGKFEIPNLGEEHDADEVVVSQSYILSSVAARLSGPLSLSSLCLLQALSLSHTLSHRHKHIETLTNRQTNRQTDRHTHTHTQTHTHTHTHMLSLSFCFYYSHTLSFTHSLSLSLSLSVFHSFSFSSSLSPSSYLPVSVVCS